MRNCFVIFVLPLLLTFLKVHGQVPQTAKTSFSLDEVIYLAKMQSTAIKYAQNRNVNFYWRYRNFRTRHRPQLILRSDLPHYSRTNEAVKQPDGGIKFIPTEIGKMNARLSLNQSIGLTGTNIYSSSTLYRVNNYKDGNLEYSGNPVVIGFNQPILNYNWMRWSQKTEPLIYDEAQKDFIQSVEQIAYTATDRYFDYLMVQTNYQLSLSNLKNSEDNLAIAETNIKLGRISENDYARIKLSVFNARKAVNKYNADLKNADFELKSFIGLDPATDIELELPLNMYLFEIDAGLALKEARENRKETPYFERRLIEAERELVKAKRSTGVTAYLHGEYGLSNNDETITGIYDQPETALQLNLSLTVPILDWGRSASTIRLAESQYELVQFDVEQDIKDFERRVVVLVEQFSLLEEQIKTSKEADVVANNGYEIALRKFKNGEISITDLNIALQDRENAKRDYIRSIENYWLSYYRLRILTLYDFLLKTKIQYDGLKTIDG
jgi:outer membrane protein